MSAPEKRPADVAESRRLHLAAAIATATAWAVIGLTLWTRGVPS